MWKCQILPLLIKVAVLKVLRFWVVLLIQKKDSKYNDIVCDIC